MDVISDYVRVPSAKISDEKTVLPPKDNSRTDPVVSGVPQERTSTSVSGVCSVPSRQGLGLERALQQVSRLVGRTPLRSGASSQDNPSDAKQALEQLQALVLKERSRTSLNNSKRFYTVGIQTPIQHVFFHLPLSRIALGSTSANRTGDVVSCRTLTLQLKWIRTPGSGAINTLGQPPVLRWVLWRDKVPATPGTPTATLGTSANPPNSNTDMYSRLAQAAVSYNSVAIRPADTFDRYHIYRTGIRTFNHDEVYYDESGSHAAMPTRVWHEVIHQELHDVEITFASDSTSNAMLNDLYFSGFTDVDITAFNYTLSLQYSSDLTFRDKQL